MDGTWSKKGKKGSKGMGGKGKGKSKSYSAGKGQKAPTWATGYSWWMADAGWEQGWGGTLRPCLVNVLMIWKQLKG